MPVFSRIGMHTTDFVPPPPDFDPSHVTSAISWWDASDTATVTAPGGLVSLWEDKIGAADFVNGDFSAGMDYGLELVNGRNTISATHGAYPHYQALRHVGTPYTTGFPGAAGTFYIVMKNVITQTSDGFFTMRNGSDSNAPGFNFMQFKADDNYRIHNYGDMYFGNGILVTRHGIEHSNSYNDSIPHIWKMRWDAGTGAVATLIDGANLKSNTGYTSYGTTSYQGIELNTSVFSSNIGSNSYCEIVLCNAAIADGSADDLAMMDYLARKWGTPSANRLTTTTVRQGATSGGARVRGLSIANDGSLAMTTNAPGVWRYSGGTNHKFFDLFTQERLPGTLDGWLEFPEYHHGFDVAIAPNNSNRVWAITQYPTGGFGLIWRSDNGGATWNSPTQAILYGRHDEGPSIIVDPVNDGHVLIGSSDGHIWETYNDGTAWTERTIGGVSGYACMAFDISGGNTTVSGETVTNNLYRGWTGSPVQFSTNGGVSFSAVASSPASVRYMSCAPNGTLYVCSNAGTTTNAYKLASGTWTNFTSGAMTATGATWAAVAADPNNVGDVAFVTTDCKLQFTPDAGTNFYVTSPGTPSTSFEASKDVGWLERPFNGVHPPNFGFNYTYAATKLQYDPSVSGRVYMGTGEGLFYVTPSSYAGQTTPSIDWTQQNKGAPGIVINDLVRVGQWDNPDVLSGGIEDSYNNMLFACQGKTGIMTGGPRTEPVFFITGAIANGLAVDWDKANPLSQFILVDNKLWKSVVYGADGFDVDKGAVTGLVAPAMMAVQNANNICVISNGGSKYTTAGGGGSWNNCLFAGSPITFSFGNVHTLVCDRVTASTMYFIRPDTGGCWKSTDSGATWAQQSASSPGFYSVGGQLSSTPGFAGQLLFAAGKSLADTLRRSSDGGLTWFPVTSVTQAWQVSAGKIKPGGTYPSVYITGLISGDSEPGVFRSDDFTSNTAIVPTWVRVSNAPGGNMDDPNKLFADIDTYGSFYLMMGTGYMFGELDPET